MVSIRESTHFVCFFNVFPIIWTNAVEGIRQVSKELLQMRKLYGCEKQLDVYSLHGPYLIANSTAPGLGWKVTVAEVLAIQVFHWRPLWQRCI